jgi:hypothetical protein
MKWLFVCLAVCFLVAPAMAGEDPYIAIVGTDCVPGSTNILQGACAQGNGVGFYFSPKHQQFMYNELFAPFFIPATFGSFPPVNQYTRVGGAGQEQFRSQTLDSQPEVCHLAPAVPTDALQFDGFITLPNAKTPAGNAGFYEWYIRLPKKPDGEINIVFECGVVKPNAVAVYGYEAIELCAAETGERIGAGTCVRQEVDPGVSPVINTALPRITAIAYPGPYNVPFAPFNLTAFKNPSSYTLTFDDKTGGAMLNNGNDQVLDGGPNTRILLKACMDKTIVTKLPVTGQLNALLQTENDLEMGDMIYVRMDVPRQNTVDIYCHQQSVRIAGIGESPF